MKNLVIIMAFTITALMKGYSQADTTRGIAFEHGLSWREVLQKAKKENKYVFVDCYATWCSPCKMMDKNVYTNDAVASYMNSRYISVKVQMDRTPVDNDSIKCWYGAAEMLAENYSVNA